ncbi:MAG: hypothetical protein LBF44_00575 [Holosporaceae bacterium]|nr:hypothetical protein [Holosporaceae bacterium]
MLFYTDAWNGFSAVLPKRRLIIGKSYTTTIEQNSNTRHYLGRMTRRTKVVSKSEEMLNCSLKLLFCLSYDDIYDHFYKIFLSIFA